MLFIRFRVYLSSISVLNATAIVVGNTNGVCLPAAMQFEERLKSQGQIRFSCLYILTTYTDHQINNSWCDEGRSWEDSHENFINHSPGKRERKSSYVFLETNVREYNSSFLVSNDNDMIKKKDLQHVRKKWKRCLNSMVIALDIFCY